MKGVAVLQISTFRGTCPGARHYYGCIYGQDAKRQDVRRVIGSAEAKRLNEQRAETTWQPGDETTAFDSREAVIAQAKKQWKRLCPDALVLLVGGFAIADPQQCIAGTPSVRRKINTYWKRFESLRANDSDYNDAMEAVSDEYDEYMCSLEVDR